MTEATRKTPVAHVDVLLVDLRLAVKIDVMDMDSVKRANEVINEAIDEFKAGPEAKTGEQAVMKDERRLGRVAGDKF